MTSKSPQILLVVGTRIIWRCFQPIARELRRRGVGFRILGHSWAPAELQGNAQTQAEKPRQKLNSEFKDTLISQQEAEQQSWRYVVYSEALAKLQLQGHKVYVSHGMMYGNVGWTRELASFADTFVCRCSAEFDYLDKVLGNGVDRLQRFNFGNPRMDLLSRYRASSPAKKRRTKQEILRRFGFSSDKPVIMVTSHYTPSSNLKTFGAAMLEAISNAFPDAQVLATCHGGFFGPKPNHRFATDAKPAGAFDFDAFSSSVERLKKTKQVAFVVNIDPYELLPSADLVVCDYSSVMLEAAALGIPILHRCSAYNFDESVAGILENSGREFHGLHDMIDAIRPHIAGQSEDAFCAGREAFVRHFFVDTGHCVSDICSLLQTPNE